MDSLRAFVGARQQQTESHTISCMHLTLVDFKYLIAFALHQENVGAEEFGSK